MLAKPCSCLADGCPADRVSYAILIDSLLARWAADREGRAALLARVEERWASAAAPGGPLAPHTFLHQDQGRLVLDLHGYSAWTGQLAVLATLADLQARHARGEGLGGLRRLDIITGRGNRRWGLGGGAGGGEAGASFAGFPALWLHSVARPLCQPGSPPSPPRPRSTRRHQPVLRELVLEMLQALLPVALGRSNDGILVLEGRQLAKLFDALAAQGKGLSVREVAQLLVDPAAV